MYVKNNIHYKRRSDLEIIGTECIWIELVLLTKHILFGCFLPTTAHQRNAALTYRRFYPSGS